MQKGVKLAVVRIMVACIMSAAIAGCNAPSEPPSEPSISVDLPEPSAPPPAYAEGSPLSEEYSIILEGFDPVAVEAANPRNWTTVYDVGPQKMACLHAGTEAVEGFDFLRSNATQISALLSIFPTGADQHPILLLLSYPRDVVEHTGMLKFGDTLYTRSQLEEYLVYTDEKNYIYQLQPLACGQPFADCWEQLMQYARELREEEGGRWYGLTLHMDYNNRALEAAEYFTRNISNLIVPYDPAIEEANQKLLHPYRARSGPDPAGEEETPRGPGCPWCGGRVKQINRAPLYSQDCPVSPGNQDWAYEYTYECQDCGDIDTMISNIICAHQLGE